jgi:hypothetical protein
MQLTRRSFLALPAFVPLLKPLLKWRGLDFGEHASLHRFAFDHVLGTSMDLEIWTASSWTAKIVRDAMLAEIERLTSILNTRDPDSEICRVDEGAKSDDGIDNTQSGHCGDQPGAWSVWQAGRRH